MKSITLAILIASIALSMTSLEPALAQSGVWSEIVDGIQGRLWIAKSGNTFNETELTDVYLQLRNVSGGIIPIEIYYDTVHPMTSCEVVDREGQIVQQTASVASILRPEPFWLTLPEGGSLQFIASVSGYGIPKRSGIMIQMSCGAWALKPAGGVMFLRATIKVEPPLESSGHQAWHGTLALPPAPIPIE